MNKTRKEMNNVDESKKEVNKTVHKTIEEVNKAVKKTVEETEWINEDIYEEVKLWRKLRESGWHGQFEA